MRHTPAAVSACLVTPCTDGSRLQVWTAANVCIIPDECTRCPVVDAHDVLQTKHERWRARMFPTAAHDERMGLRGQFWTIHYNYVVALLCRASLAQRLLTI